MLALITVAVLLLLLVGVVYGIRFFSDGNNYR